MRFKTVDDIWNAIDKGKTIFWCNENYKVFVEDNIGSAETTECDVRQYSARNGKMLSIRCISNYFGSVISKGDLPKLFVKQNKRGEK